MNGEIRAAVGLAVRGSWFGRVGFVATFVVSALIQFAILAVLAVYSIGPDDGPYASGLLQQPALRRGLMIGMALLIVPLVVLVAQCSQLAGPARDRRLAAYRLAGGTPSQVRWIAAGEAVAPVFAGIVLGTGLFIAGQLSLEEPSRIWGTYITETVTRNGPNATTIVSNVHEGWVRVAPTDVRVAPLLILYSWILTLLVAVASTRVALRRVEITPLSVIRRRAATAPPGSMILVLLMLGLGGLLGFSLVRSMLGQPGHTTRLDVILVLGFFALSAGGLILGVASLSSRVGKWVSEGTGRPSFLIAGRRLEVDPYAPSRTLSLIVIALTVAICGQAVKAHFLVITDPSDTFYADSLLLVDVAYVLALFLASLGVVLRVLEGVTTNRSQYAIQLASGVPKSTLRSSAVLETLIPLAPTVVMACVIGVLGTRGVLGTGHSQVVGTGRFSDVVTVPIPIMWTETVALSMLVLALTSMLSWMTFSFALRQSGPGDLRISN